MKEILITSSVLILALLILRLVFAKKVRRRLIYGAWALVALRLLVPVQIGEMDFSILTSAKPVTEVITQVTDKQVAGVTEQDAYREIIQDYVEKDQTVFTPEVQEHIQSAIKDDMPKEEIAVMIDKVYAEQEIFVPEVQEQVQRQVEETADPITLGQIAIAVWLAGVVVMAVWFVIVNLRHSRMLRKNREQLDCDSPIPVYVSQQVSSPCLVGFLHPVVYLTPESAEPERLRHVLTHELTHYAHKDHIWSLVRCVCLCVYWFRPLVWVAAWFSRRDCELACDEGALERLGEEERIAYGKTLLDVVSHAAAHAHLLQTATAMNETKKQLKERVNFIVKKPKLSIIAAVCMVLVCAIVAGCVAAGPAASTSPELPELEPDKSPLPSYDTLLQIAEGMSLKEVMAIAGAPQRMAKHRIPWSPDASGLARVGWVHVFDSQEGKSVGVAFVLKEGEEDYVAEYVFPDFQDTEEKYTVTVESGEQWLYGPLDEYYIFGETGFLMLRNEPGVEYRVFANGKQLEKVKSLTEESFVSYQFMVGQENVVITVEAQVDQALLEIRQAAVKRFSTASDTCKPEEVGLRIISQFGDTYALFVDLPFMMYMQAFWTEKVNDLIFRYSNGQQMYIYADGEFYTFQKAFDEKIITADQLTTIWEDYNARGKEPLATTNGSGRVETYDITVWVPYGMKELTLQQIEAFNQAYAGQYLVNAKVVEETQTIYKVHVVGISAPDLHCFYETDMVSMITNGMVSQLGVKNSGLVRENHHATAVEAASYNGGVYAYPVTATPHMILYYDKSVISEQDVGSLEALIAACENSGRKLSFDLSQPQYASAFFRATGCVSEWSWNESGEFVSVHDTYNSPEGLIAARMMRTLLVSPCYRGSADTGDFGKEVPSAVVISSPGDYMYDAAKGILGDNLGVAQMPAFTADGKRYPLISSGGGLLLGVTPQGNVRRQAMLNVLAQYLTNAQCQEERYASLGMWPSQVEAQSNVASSNPCMQIAWDQPCCVMGVRPGSWWALMQDLVSDMAGSEALEEVLERHSKNIAASITP